MSYLEMVGYLLAIAFTILGGSIILFVLYKKVRCLSKKVTGQSCEDEHQIHLGIGSH